MSGYIINPSWFYWISVTGAVKVLAGILAVVGGVGAVIGLPFYYTDEVCDEEDKKFFWKITKRICLTLVILTLLAIFVPSRETLIEMQIAKYATYENAEWTVESIKSVVDYIIEAVKGAK